MHTEEESGRDQEAGILQSAASIVKKQVLDCWAGEPKAHAGPLPENNAVVRVKESIINSILSMRGASTLAEVEAETGGSLQWQDSDSFCFSGSCFFFHSPALGYSSDSFLGSSLRRTQKLGTSFPWECYRGVSLFSQLILPYERNGDGQSTSAPPDKCMGGSFPVACWTCLPIHLSSC